MRFSFVLLAAAVLAGCADLDDMRTNDPVRTGQFSGQWRAVAECINLRLNGRILYDEPNKTALVGGLPQNNFIGKPYAFYEITVAQDSPDGGHIALREKQTVFRETATYWEAVEACTGSS